MVAQKADRSVANWVALWAAMKAEMSVGSTVQVLAAKLVVVTAAL